MIAFSLNEISIPMMVQLNYARVLCDYDLLRTDHSAFSLYSLSGMFNYLVVHVDDIVITSNESYDILQLKISPSQLVLDETLGSTYVLSWHQSCTVLA